METTTETGATATTEVIKSEARNQRLVFLRVKIKSLTEEARIIRHETRRAKARKRMERVQRIALVNALTDHRRVGLRVAARRTFIAYGYLRGREYLKIEHENSRELSGTDWREIARMVVKYGSGGNDVYQPPEALKQAEEKLRLWWKVATSNQGTIDKIKDALGLKQE